MNRVLPMAAPGFKTLCCLFLFVVASVLIADKAVCRRDALSISVGGLWDLSGDHRKEGQAAYMAAKKAVECLNSQGGIGGRPLELVVADTKGEPGRLLLEARNLVEQKKVVALLGPTNETLIPVLRNYAEAHNVPMVLTSGDDPLLPFRKKEAVSWTYSISPSIGPAIKALFREFARAGLEPVAPLVAHNAQGKRASLWLQGYGPEYHLRVLPPQNFGLHDTDVISQLQQFKEEGAQVIMAWGPRSWGPVLLRSAKKTGVPVAVPVQLLSSDMLKKYTGSFRLWTAAPPVLLGYDIPLSHPCAFIVNRFMKTMGKEAMEFSVEECLAAGAAWDALHLTAIGMRTSSTATHSDLRQALEDLDQSYYGVMGVFKPRKRDHSGLVPGSLIVLERGTNGWRPVISSSRRR
ncbi:MAG: ABC transporter substrate-binding protein [Thermodesulfobacteriota bacterium]|nr:ABC transporter substrate-binding protein [Thermodesulfobacteriota bacterium]